METDLKNNTADAVREPKNIFDVVIVGAGISGMYMLYKMRELGLSTRVLEMGSDVGGTWYWNRYPGARCDTDTLEYSYSFCEELQQEWEWPERYPTQPEILRYLNHVADRFELRTDISFDTKVVGARFDELAGRWRVRTDDGAELRSQFLVMGTGCLSSPNTPHIDGTESFDGPIYHTGKWPHARVDFTGKRVGIIGTGSSGVQSIPVIAKEAGELFVFQRAPQYAIPARNGPVDREAVAEIKADYAGFRARNRLEPSAQLSHYPSNDVSALEVDAAERERTYEERWKVGGFPFYGAFNDIIINQEANDTAAEFVRGKIRSIVTDPEVAELLCPPHTIACKRAIIDTGYFETYNRSNVHLVDLQSAPIEAITPGGIRTSDAKYDLDCIVFATGFDAMTGTLLKMDIQGRGGVTLREKWAAGPRNYLGLSVPGFPNFFTVTGPGSPSVLTNMVVAIEQHVEWITDCIEFMRDHGHGFIEATQASEDEWVEHVNAVAASTLYPTCTSWYLGANIPGKPRVFMPLPGFPEYAAKCEDVAANGYEGFELT
jgi:cyclohexanone monooxygenase